MDLLDRLLRHDAWTTGQLLSICESLDDERLDRDFDIGHRTLRRTLDHIIRNMEVWSGLMAEVAIADDADRTIPGLRRRLDRSADRLAIVARRVARENAWDETWVDHLDDPPRRKSYGDAIAHILTHSMHHRAQALHLLRRVGVTSLPEGDVFSWARQARDAIE